MYCPKCGIQLAPDSRFCNQCGTPLQPGAAALSPPAGAASSEPEEELWKGRVSGKAWAHWWVAWVVWAGALTYVWFGVLKPETRAQAAAGWIALAAGGLPALLLVWTVLVQKLSTRYRLTTHRLFKETGILSRHMNELELVRVDDVSVRQNIVQRIFNVGIITVISPTDQTEPRLELTGIENPIELKEQIRTHVRKRRDRSLHVESL